MKVINIHDAKARLSEYLDLVESGERVLICRRNHPIAELTKVGASRTEPRPLGGTLLDIPDLFYAPLPDDEVEAFYGGSQPAGSTVAEVAPPYDAADLPGGRGERR